MKHQQQFWNRAIDDFLPKDRQKWSVIELYRGRALVRTSLLSAVLHPFLFLFEINAWESWLQMLLAGTLFTIPVLLVWIYRRTNRLRLCTIAYLCYCSGAVAWAQQTAGTMHAMYWLWFCFLIVFSVLVLGVKEGGIYTALLMIVSFFVLQDNISQGHTVGRFPDKEALLASITAQLVTLQIAFVLLMTAYDAIRNRAETRAVMLRFTDEEADRLATIGERMGGMAHELNEQLNQFQGQLLRLDVMAKRSDTKVEDLQKLISELQQRSQRLAAISKISNG